MFEYQTIKDPTSVVGIFDGRFINIKNVTYIENYGDNAIVVHFVGKDLILHGYTVQSFYDELYSEDKNINGIN